MIARISSESKARRVVGVLLLETGGQFAVIVFAHTSNAIEQNWRVGRPECPTSNVARDQMATFLRLALGWRKRRLECRCVTRSSAARLLSWWESYLWGRWTALRL